MLRDLLDAMADNLMSTVGAELAADNIDIQVVPMLVPIQSAPICIDMMLFDRPR